MRILVLGANGLIGSAVAARLDAAGHSVVGVGRDLDMARRRFPHEAWIAADLRRMLAPADWAPHLGGIDAVVNCAGALQDSARDDTRAVHLDSPLALYRACEAAGVRRIVHVSAAGVARDRATAFSATKFAMEEALRTLDLDWLILRPGLVIAPAAYGGTSLLRGLAGFPVVVPAVHWASVVQVVSIEDVATTVLAAVEGRPRPAAAHDLVHPEPTTIAVILERLRGWLGFPAAPLVQLPAWAAGLVARANDLVAWLGWRSAMRSTSLAQLRDGVRGDPGSWIAEFAIRPLSLDEMLERYPSGVQERWFARLYFLKPAALLTLVVFFALSGLVGLLRLDAAASVLVEAGWPRGGARIAVAIGSVLDVVLAALLCFRNTARAALRGMIALSLLYLLAGTVSRPDLWLDPLGAFLKILPVIMLSTMALAVMDER
jgi:uncharacterized protein YbjT (DUF2867 family)